MNDWGFATCFPEIYDNGHRFLSENGVRNYLDLFGNTVYPFWSSLLKGIEDVPNNKMQVREVEVRQAVEASRRIPGIQGAAVHRESNELFIEAIIRGKHRIVEPRRFIRIVSEMQTR